MYCELRLYLDRRLIDEGYVGKRRKMQLYDGGKLYYVESVGGNRTSRNYYVGYFVVTGDVYQVLLRDFFVWEGI